MLGSHSLPFSPQVRDLRYTQKPSSQVLFLEPAGPLLPLWDVRLLGRVPRSPELQLSPCKNISEGFSPGPMRLAWSRASASSPLLSDLQQTLAREGGFLMVRWRGVWLRCVCRGECGSGMCVIPAGLLRDGCGQEWKALLSSVP